MNIQLPRNLFLVYSFNCTWFIQIQNTEICDIYSHSQRRGSGDVRLQPRDVWTGNGAVLLGSGAARQRPRDVRDAASQPENGKIWHLY